MEGVDGEAAARGPNRVLFCGAETKFWEIVMGTEHLIKSPYSYTLDTSCVMGNQRL